MFDLVPLVKNAGYFGLFAIIFAESGLLVGFFLLLMIGVPVAITLATVGFVFGGIGFGCRYRRGFGL